VPVRIPGGAEGGYCQAAGWRLLTGGVIRRTSKQEDDMRNGSIAGAVLGLALGGLLTGVAFAEEVTLEHEGVTLNGQLELAPDKSLEDGVVLMTHGTLAHNEMEIISQLQEQFRDRGVNTLAINLSLGKDERHGPYDCDEPHRHRHTDAVEEIGAWVAWLEEQGAQDIVLLGHSRGGNQTAWYAAEAPEPTFAAVVLLAPSTWDEGRARSAYETTHGAPLEPVLERAQEMVREGRGDEMMEGVGFLYCEQTSATAEAFVSYYEPDVRFDSPRLLPHIEAPTLVIAGSADTITPDLPERMDLTAKEEIEHVELVVIDGADHFFRDLYVDDVVDAVLEFTEGLADPAA
jgi:pimeloyl-ACP methyl ester carboxylesterase